jgi:hypothetical protein
MLKRYLNHLFGKKSPNETISKTDYVRYLECPRYAWLSKNRPDLSSDEDSVVAKQGMEVELLARGLFKKGVEIKVSGESGTAETKRLLNEGAEIIYQAQPVSKKFLARADILIKKEDGWHLYEVKSSTQIKPEHIPDLCFQVNVFKEFGIELKTINLIHINSEYVYREKNGLEVNKLFVTENVTDIVTDGLEAEVKKMKTAHKILTSKKEPKVAVLKRNFHHPMSANMSEYYWKGIPDYSIYDISGINPNKLKALEARGIMKITDIPDNFPLSANQIRQVRMTKEKGIEVHKEFLAKELEQIEFPIWFLDYETVQLAIPKFEGMRPWQQMAMQYSLHKLDDKGNLTHFSFLHTKTDFPFPHLLKHLKADIGETGTVMSWNSSFEKERNKDMAEAMPDYKEFLMNINRRVYDPMKIFKSIYTDYRFKGGTSLKTVLPVLVPDLSYATLEIHGGGDATAALYDIITGTMKDIETAKKQLLEYCELDTLAMVRIYQFLIKI